MSDTIAAIATAPGKAGIAVVRVSGPDAFDIAQALTKKRPQPGRFFYHDHKIILGFKSPHSYTGEDVVEFQCYGGSITPHRMLAACFEQGARLARKGEFTERAFLNGKLSLDQAEGVIALIDAKTEAAAKAAKLTLDGATHERDLSLYHEALAISAELEHALDISEDELPDGFCSRLHIRVEDLRLHLEREIAKAKHGALLHEGALVVLAGPPNAGKSSLMNALLEERRAIVSDVPGTTRDSIEAWIDLGGFPIRLVDTAGLRQTDDAIEAEGVDRANALIDEADVVLDLGGTLKMSNVITVSAKCDLVRGAGVNVSAKTGEGLEELKREIVARVDSLEPKLPSRKIDLLIAAHDALSIDLGEVVLAANALRGAAEKLGELIGATYSEDLLDNIFSRFCVGK